MPWQTLEAIIFDRPVKCFLPHRGCIFEYIILICFKPFAYFTPFAHLWDVFSSRKGRCPCSFFWVGVPPAFASGAKSGTSTSPTCRPSDSGSGSSGWCPLGFIHSGQQPDPFKKKLQDMSPTLRWRTYKNNMVQEHTFERRTTNQVSLKVPPEHCSFFWQSLRFAATQWLILPKRQLLWVATKNYEWPSFSRPPLPTKKEGRFMLMDKPHKSLSPFSDRYPATGNVLRIAQ